jgi:hypothetical protein
VKTNKNKNFQSILSFKQILHNIFEYFNEYDIEFLISTILCLSFRLKSEIHL